MVWVERDAATAAGFVNLDQAQDIRVGGPDGNGEYFITAFASTVTAPLNGRWATAADALEALRKLVDGVDPSTY